jgi:hypothetical protein
VGCEPVLNLVATPDKAVSIICTIADKIPLTSGRSWCMWAILLTSQGLQLASCRCTSFDLSLASFDIVDLCIWAALSRHIDPRKFLLIQCTCLFCWTGHFDTFMFKINYWLLYHQVAWQPCLVWVLDHQSFGRSWGVWWLYCESPGHSSAIDHSQTFRCLNIINNYKTSIKPIS